MSLRRLALIAPLTLKHSKQNHSNVNNSTSSQMTTPINGMEQSATTTTIFDVRQTTLSKSHRIIKNNNIDNDGDDLESYMDESSANSTDDSNEAYANIIHTHPSGDGFQTIRAGFGISGLIGHNPGGGSSSSGNGGAHQTYPHAINGNANLLLCGAMLSVVSTILCVVCYCCHRNIKKRTEAAYRQQHQWLESDPNMEIYSVEQSYETSAHFVAESNDGFTTMAMLHHEPPPSYDAVVVMQQQLYQQQQYLLHQQQQQSQTHLLHNSPPPGYRSTLAVNEITTPTISASAAASNMAINMLNTGSNSDLNGSCNISISGNSTSGNSCNNFFAFSKPNAPSNRCNVSNTDEQFLNMKGALNAHSCCSLQRAEVENMWNAAAAAVAVRASRATSSPCDASSLTSGNVASSSSTTTNNRNHISPMLLARKTLPLTLPAKFTTKAGGPRYLSHHSTYYRRGCPLCGKFRYDGDETLTLTAESSLDAPTTSSTVTANTIKSAPKYENVADESNNNMLSLDGSCPKLSKMDEEQSSNNMITTKAYQHATGDDIRANNITADVSQTDELEKCACGVNILESTTTVIIDSDCNGNNNNRLHVLPSSTNDNVSEEPMDLGALECNANSVMIDHNANGEAMTEELNDMVISPNSDVTDSAALSTPNVNCGPTVLPADTTLDDLNVNSGIIRVDMTKIIDQTGLPTYEAVAKLESSGYV